MNFSAEDTNYEISDDAEGDISQEMDHFIDKITNGKVSKTKKDQLISSLSKLIQETTNRMIDSIPENSNGMRNEMLYDDSANLVGQVPCINIIIGSPPIDMSCASNYPCNPIQQQPMPMLPNQYPMNFPFYQLPQNQYQQPLQQPNLFGYNQLPIPLPELPSKSAKSKSKDHKKKEDKKSKKKSSKKSSKSKSKSKKDKKEKKKKDEIIQLQYQEGKNFNGIIKYLTDKTHGNIHDNGTIEVTSDSILPGYPPKNLLNTIKKDQYQSKGLSLAWILFDFKDMRIELSNYTIESCSWSKNIGHIKSWVIEISDDNQSWSIIDQKDDCPDLNDRDAVRTYEVQPNKFSRYVRFRHTAECWDGGTFGFNAIEFYGRLKIPSKE